MIQIHANIITITIVWQQVGYGNETDQRKQTQWIKKAASSSLWNHSTNTDYIRWNNILYTHAWKDVVINASQHGEETTAIIFFCSDCSTPLLENLIKTHILPCYEKTGIL